jgi:hypothetical protein
MTKGKTWTAFVDDGTARERERESETGNEKMREKEETEARCFIDRRYIYTSLKVGSASLTGSSDVMKAICIKCVKLDFSLMAFMSSAWHSKVVSGFGTRDEINE